MSSQLESWQSCILRISASIQSTHIVYIFWNHSSGHYLHDVIYIYIHIESSHNWCRCNWKLRTKLRRLPDSSRWPNESREETFVMYVHYATILVHFTSHITLLSAARNCENLSNNRVRFIYRFGTSRFYRNAIARPF